MSVEKPIERTARLLDLIPFINSHQGIHIDDLAEEFNVSAEVIAKDLDLLFLCGLPSYTPLELIDLSYEGGYVTIRDAQNLNKPRRLNKHEVSSLLLGLSELKSTLKNTKERERIDELSKKLRDVLNIQSQQFISYRSVDQSVYSEILGAISSEKAIRIEYLSASKDQKSERTISPIEIIHQSNREHVIAYCHTAKEQRVFDIAGIKKVSTSNELYMRKQRMSSLIDQADASVAISYSGSGVSFIEDNPELVVAHDPAEKTAIMKFWNTEWLIRSVMSYGGAVMVREPKLIVNALQDRVAISLQLYRS